jgi:uncharacterized membrane protein
MQLVRNVLLFYKPLYDDCAVQLHLHLWFRVRSFQVEHFAIICLQFVCNFHIGVVMKLAICVW